MSRKVILIGGAILLLCMTCAVAALLFHRAEQRRRQEAEALHRAALADSAEIDRGIKTYWDRQNLPMKLHNDLLQLQNDDLDARIAMLRGLAPNRRKIEADLAIVQNDKLAISMLDPNAPALDPYQAEARIQEHNRKYPHDKLASIANINQELEQFHSKINAIVEQSDKKLRQAREP